MRTKAHLIASVYLVFLVSGSLFGIGEKTVSLGGESLSKMAGYYSGLVTVSRVRPTPVLALSSARSGDPVLDMSLSFDEGEPSLFRDSAGNYRLTASPLLAAVDRRNARAGFGAVLFSRASQVGSTAVGAQLVIEAQGRAALFSAGNRINDFTLEFWLHPVNLENGEEILLWSSTLPGQAGSMSSHLLQRVKCVSSRNRLQWSFHNFFVSPDGAKNIDVNIGGVSPVVPRTWSHHLIRFDSNTGLIEYLMNGKSEAIAYATPTGRESGEVYTPLVGGSGRFVLGSFSGIMDEFKVHGAYEQEATLRRYPARGGRIETTAIDLGAGNNSVRRIDAFGGRTSIANASLTSDYRQNGSFRFADNSEMQFFIRSSSNPHLWDSPWMSVTLGADFAEEVSGRYIQLAVDFYPSFDGETSPFLEEIRVTYLPDEPPIPPGRFTAVALDGAVQLQWQGSPSRNAKGYLVYYGTASGEFFGTGSLLGVSPVDVGNRTSVVIDGLENGTLYFFCVAAYSDSGAAGLRPGEFSREIRSRPLLGLSATSPARP
jgi:hypothetical protein